MIKWEYKDILIPSRTFIAELNILGNDGWELLELKEVATRYRLSNKQCFMKRCIKYEEV